MGAPDHPHRGFETVTYVLSGEMEHEDSAGHRGTLGPGDVQWMTAGAGVVHAEMPSARFRQRGGRLHGLQIWVNLRAREKMIAPRYQELSAGQIPAAESADHLAHVRVVAGEALGARATIDTHTPVVYLDWTLQLGAHIEQPTPVADQVIAYVFEGRVELGPDQQLVSEGQLAIFDQGETVMLQVPASADRPARLLLLAGAPLDEPVARSGPFVMNTRAEIDAAVRDYRAGRLGEIGSVKIP